MPKRILVINGHPDRLKPHLCASLVEAYAGGAVAAGHEIRRIDLASLTFPMLHSQEEFESRIVPDALRQAAEDVRWAEHLVFVFPLWLGTMPALLKAFLEQIMRPSIAFEYGKPGSMATPLLKGRSARIIVTMGMPPIVYRLWFLNHGIAALRRGILNFVGIRPVRETYYGMLDRASDATRAAWIEEVRAFGRKAR